VIFSEAKRKDFRKLCKVFVFYLLLSPLNIFFLTKVI
jgi:hypothetical protein